MATIPTIKITDNFDICVYFCFMLNNLGDLNDFIVSEIVMTLESVNYFELMSEISRMEKKKLINIKSGKERGENIYSLLPDGKVLAEEFLMHIPLSIREKTIKTGTEIIERIEREKSVVCFVNYDFRTDRYDLVVKFLNEMNGTPIIDLKIYAPDEESAVDMKERFLSRSSLVIKRIMNVFLKDDYFLFDD